MRRPAPLPSLAAASLLAAALLPGLLPAPARAQARGEPPHAWLFGSWTGGIFPVPAGAISAQACLATPVVIFTRDVVLRATLTDPVYLQREIETVRTSPQGAEFRFTAAPGSGQAAQALGLAGQQAPGFGCESADVLHVLRQGENEISFPGCADFPNPLVRCPSR